ncbi:expressed unknown protein [Seminavis robusta]|uniref:Uncharacterized protein n=1 Tax=Seminavis robusta TaxID=568900 RepID=A0A9N8DHF5_9STRA|nr:expressed unknown protein [Seminavis robusta]|eukprot:Sro144_g067080.1 n/a (308) ;mRNA; r:76612-77640
MCVALAIIVLLLAGAGTIAAVVIATRSQDNNSVADLATMDLTPSPSHRKHCRGSNLGTTTRHHTKSHPTYLSVTFPVANSTSHPSPRFRADTALNSISTTPSYLQGQVFRGTSWALLLPIVILSTRSDIFLEEIDIKTTVKVDGCDTGVPERFDKVDECTFLIQPAVENYTAVAPDNSSFDEFVCLEDFLGPLVAANKLSHLDNGKILFCGVNNTQPIAVCQDIVDALPVASDCSVATTIDPLRFAHQSYDADNDTLFFEAHPPGPYGIWNSNCNSYGVRSSGKLQYMQHKVDRTARRRLCSLDRIC